MIINVVLLQQVKIRIFSIFIRSYPLSLFPYTFFHPLGRLPSSLCAYDIFLFHLLCLQVDHLSFLIPFATRQLLHSVLHFHQLSSVLYLAARFNSQFFVQLLYLKLMLFLQLFQGQVSSCLIVAHVVVPCAAEFQELRPLCAFNRN